MPPPIDAAVLPLMTVSSISAAPARIATPPPEAAVAAGAALGAPRTGVVPADSGPVPSVAWFDVTLTRGAAGMNMKDAVEVLPVDGRHAGPRALDRDVHVGGRRSEQVEVAGGFAVGGVARDLQVIRSRRQLNRRVARRDAIRLHHGGA